MCLAVGAMMLAVPLLAFSQQLAPSAQAPDPTPPPTAPGAPAIAPPPPPVVPAPPGTVFRDESVLSRWLDVHYAKLHEAMAIIEQRGDGRAPYDYVRMELGA